MNKQNLVRPIAGKGRPRKFQIPNSFSCLGHKVNIVIVTQADLQELAADLGTHEGSGNDKFCGLYDHENKTIYLADDVTGSTQEQTFLHELMHCILLHTGYEELSEDEVLVDMLGELFYQFIVTKKGYINYEPWVKKEATDGQEALHSQGN